MDWTDQSHCRIGLGRWHGARWSRFDLSLDMDLRRRVLLKEFAWKGRGDCRGQDGIQGLLLLRLGRRPGQCGHGGRSNSAMSQISICEEQIAPRVFRS